MAMSNMLTRSFSQALGFVKQQTGAQKDCLDFKTLLRSIKNDCCLKEEKVATYLLKCKEIIPDMSKSQKVKFILSLIYICNLNLCEESAVCSLVPFVVTFVDQARTVVEKCVGYHAMTSMMNVTSNQENCYLYVNTIIKDLNDSKRPRVVKMALKAASNIKEVSLLNSLVNHFERKLHHDNAEVRQQAFVTLHRLYSVDKSLVRDVESHVKLAICDRDPLVMSYALPYIHLLLKDNRHLQRTASGKLLQILQQAFAGRLPDHMTRGGVCAPTTQLNLLRILCDVTVTDGSHANELDVLLNQMLRRYQSSVNPVNLYLQSQCVQLIFKNPENIKHSCFQLAINSLDVFLQVDKTSAKDINLLSIGLQHLSNLSSISISHCYKFQAVLMECLSHNSLTIQKQALMVVPSLTNNENFESVFQHLTSKLKKYQNKTDFNTFIQIMSEKCCEISVKFSSGSKALLDRLYEIVRCSEEFCSDVVIRTLIKTLNEGSEDTKKDELRRCKNIISQQTISYKAYQVVLSIVSSYYKYFDDETLVEVFESLAKHCEQLKDKNNECVLNFALSVHTVMCTSTFSGDVKYKIHEVVKVFSKVVETNPALYQVLSQIKDIYSDDSFNNDLESIKSTAEDEDFSFLDQYIPTTPEIHPEIISKQSEFKPSSVSSKKIRNKHDMAAHVHQPASNQQQKPSFLQKLQNEQVKQGDALQGSVLWGSNAMLSSNGSPATSQVLSDDVTGSRDDVTDEVFGNALFNLSME